jgi:dCMP deaminase
MLKFTFSNALILNKRINIKYMNSERPSWDEYFTKIVQVTSERSPCKRLHVGCLLVKDNRIVSQGYNGFLPGCVHTSIIRDDHEQAIVHAEQNALADCAKRGVSCNESTAYVTHYPCIICARLMFAAGVKEVKYLTDYHNDELVAIFASQCGVIIEKLV